MYCIQYIGYVRVYMLSRPHHDNHKFMCLQNAVTILHKNYLFVIILLKYFTNKSTNALTSCCDIEELHSFAKY